MFFLREVFHVSFPALGIENLEISRTAFELSIFGKSFPVYWYGIGYALGFGLCLYLALRHAERYGLKKEQLTDAYLALMLLGLLGGRLYYVLFSLDNYRDNWLSIFNFRDGGMGFYGGVIGGIIALILAAKKQNKAVSVYLDYFAVYLPLGQAIGRWGNFFNQEAFGGNTELPWGMISEGTRSYLAKLGPPYNPAQPVHPTFLYEFLGNMLIFIVLLKLRPKLFGKRPYSLLCSYLLGYGLLRFVVEGLRTDSLYIWHSNIRVSQALSLVMVIASAAVLYWIFRRQERQPTETEV
ncbi:MAG: prolipoprotein diacylglyceryl transferase [Eubacteriales bacterium]|nr:prolipoprotein diacylglyceryl transferase [Eubacteriales bacterium]